MFQQHLQSQVLCGKFTAFLFLPTAGFVTRHKLNLGAQLWFLLVRSLLSAWWARAAPVSRGITRQCGNDWAIIWDNTIQALKVGDFFSRVWHSNRSLQNLFFQAVKTHCICSISYWNLTKKPKIRFPFPDNKAIPSRLELGMDFIYIWQFLLNNWMFFGVLCADVWEYVRQSSFSLCV